MTMEIVGDLALPSTLSAERYSKIATKCKIMTSHWNRWILDSRVISSITVALYTLSFNVIEGNLCI
jgi:hypothetical protein